MRFVTIAVFLTACFLSGFANAQATTPLQESFQKLDSVATSGGGEVPFAPQLDECSGADQQTCTFTVFEGAVLARAELGNGDINAVSYELAEGAAAPGALFASIAITLNMLAPHSTSQARGKIMTDMISSLARGSDSYNAEIDNVLLSFENNTPTGAIGRFQITR